MAQVNPASTGKENPGAPEESKNGTVKKNTKKKQTVRTRVSQACDRCRDRKDRCDGRKPRCENCTTNGRECSYDTNVKKRGLPEGYVRGMEKLWGFAIKEVEDVEENMITAMGGDNEQLAMWNDEANSENLVGLWRKSQISQKLESLLSSMSLEPAEGVKRKRADSGPQSSKKGAGAKATNTYLTPQAENSLNEWDIGGYLDPGLDMRTPVNAPSPMSFQPVSQAAPHVSVEYNGPSTSAASNPPESILSPSSANPAPSVTSCTAPVIPDLPSETWHLLDVYFSYTHSWLPIIAKSTLLRISHQYSRRNPSAPDSGSGDRAVLWAAIAYAKFQHRAINNIPRALGSVGEMVWTAEKMYNQARTFIPNEEGTLEIGHVQALLILTLANMGTDHLSRAWFLIGHAVRAAIELQLDQPSEHSFAASKSKLRAKHVYLGCFVVDTLVAARLGRRPHIRAAEVAQVGSLEEDEQEEWDPWTDCLSVRRSSTSNHSRIPAEILSTFNKLVQVLRILNEAICMIATTPASTRQLSAEFVEKLLAWTRTQPSPSHFDTDSMQSAPALSLLPHQYHLHGVYSTTLATSYLLAANHNNNAMAPAAKSARRTTDILSQYSNTFGLLIVPPTYEYYIKTAYDVVNAVQSSIDHTHIVINDWRRSLDYCLETMEPAWPILETYRNSITSLSRLQRRESQVAFDLISGSNHSNIESESPHPTKTPQSMNSYGAVSHPSPLNGSQGQNPRNQRFTSTSSQRTASFGQSSNPGLPQNPLSIYENAHATFGMGNPPTQPSREGGQFQTSVQSLARPSIQFHPLLLKTLSKDTDVMGEPVFGDLMRLDATEWTGNLDQSLVNLGFTDQDNPQAFYTICQQPDPLQSNNVFQQLAANSAAETMSYLDNAAFGGLGLGLPGFEGFGFGVDENMSEGIEAGQILQALAAGEQGGQQSSRIND